ncbi:MAG: DUF3800 domain-containing protein [Patescibacteria group bacterium]|nr:DUF3800 domain-containing protein [Patescibacteria group bacterium]
MAHIFLDESGQFTKHNDEKYFVVASFIVGDSRRTEKQFRSWQRTKFPRKLRYQPEIKFSEIKIDDSLRLKTLKFIADLDVRIYFTYLLRKNIPQNYYKKDKLQSGHLYTNIIGEALEMYLPINDLEFRVFCDKRHLKGIKRSEFKEILKARLLPQMSIKSIVQIEMIDSEQNVNIQIVDWIVGALARYLEKKELGNECYQILKNNLLGSGKELFKDIWDEKYPKQKSQSND